MHVSKTSLNVGSIKHEINQKALYRHEDKLQKPMCSDSHIYSLTVQTIQLGFEIHSLILFISIRGIYIRNNVFAWLLCKTVHYRDKELCTEESPNVVLKLVRYIHARNVISPPPDKSTHCISATKLRLLISFPYILTQRLTLNSLPNQCSQATSPNPRLYSKRLVRKFVRPSSRRCMTYKVFSGNSSF